MREALRIAYVGGDTAFAASVAHGIAAAMTPPESFAARIALVEGDAGPVQHLSDDINLLAAARRLPLQAEVRPLAAALEGAQLVLSSLSGGEDRSRLKAVGARTGWCGPDRGPGAVAAAVAVAPRVLPLAREASARCPDAPLVLLVEPPDILAGAVRRRFGHVGLRPVGLGHEVEGLRDLLAFGLGVAEGEVTLVHGGVHGMGWVARFLVAGRDGYAELGGELAALGGRPGMRPEHRFISEVYELTGLIPTSAERGWPFRPAAGGVGQPVPEPDGQDPAAWPLTHAGTGRAVGRLARALATGEPAVVSLQLPYAGESLGWAPEVTVEVPAVVTPAGIDPVPIGPLPVGVDGLPRMLGQQRAIASDYLAGPEEPLLRRALAATPEWGTPAQIRAFASALHAAFGPKLEAALKG